ncbi:MAG: four helix bundle protein [Kofleriaceae bacterium]
MLIAYTVSVELISELRPIVAAIKRHDSHLADQLRRAATNTVANLAEGQRRNGGNKNRAFENAHGEAREVLGCLDTARAWGYIVDDESARVTLDRLLALCWGLTHSKHERPARRIASPAGG